MSAEPSDLPSTPQLPGTQVPPDPVAERCHLFGPTALIVQALMGVMVITSLVIKRQLEKRKRRWQVWTMDVSKQLAGQAVIHFLNIVISWVVSTATDDKKNPCSLYFLNILLDTTFGVGIFYLAHKGFTWIFTTHYGLEGYKSGFYGHPPQWRLWACQLQPYLLAICTMKAIVVLTLTLPGLSTALIVGTQSMLAFMSNDVQVIFVLALFPLIMNVFQFCVIDQLIKAGKHVDPNAGIGGDEEDEYDIDVENGAGYRPLPTREAGETGSPARRRNSSLRDLPVVGVANSRPRADSRSSSVGISSSVRPPSRAGSTMSFASLGDEDTAILSNPEHSPQAFKSADTVWSRLVSRKDESDSAAASDIELDVPRSRRSDAPSPDSVSASQGWFTSGNGPFSDPPNDANGIAAGESAPITGTSRLGGDLERSARVLAASRGGLSRVGEDDEAMSMKKID